MICKKTRTKNIFYFALSVTQIFADHFPPNCLSATECCRYSGEQAGVVPVLILQSVNEELIMKIRMCWINFEVIVFG